MNFVAHQDGISPILPITGLQRRQHSPGVHHYSIYWQVQVRLLSWLWVTIMVNDLMEMNNILACLPFPANTIDRLQPVMGVIWN